MTLSQKVNEGPPMANSNYMQMLTLQGVHYFEVVFDRKNGTNFKNLKPTHGICSLFIYFYDKLGSTYQMPCIHITITQNVYLDCDSS